MLPKKFSLAITHPHYEFWTDPSRHRIYHKVIGSWKDINAVGNYLKDARSASIATGKIESVIVDLTEISIMQSEECIALQCEAMEAGLKAGIKIAAYVVSSANAKTDILIDKNYEKVAFPVAARFHQTKTADDWLDQYVKKHFR
ncbi:MAG: hypothetical protein EAZ55_13870 [Cytophagales bacterium]|nr:MAG: hypothetical protein EAZ55_13870 [Cytophagales bacterium]